MQEARNVLGGKLEMCCSDPMTGFYRDGFCYTGGQDLGVHVICAKLPQHSWNIQKPKEMTLAPPPAPLGFRG